MNTRVAVPLSKEAYEAVSFLAEVSGTSRGRVLAQSIEAAIPALLTIADAYREALTVEGDERQKIVKSFETAEQYLLDAMTKATGNPLHDLRRSDGRTRDAKRASVRASDPPILTGGFPDGDNGGQDEI
jgi:hypothetical protein